MSRSYLEHINLWACKYLESFNPYSFKRSWVTVPQVVATKELNNASINISLCSHRQLCDVLRTYLRPVKMFCVWFGQMVDSAIYKISEIPAKKNLRIYQQPLTGVEKLRISTKLRPQCVFKILVFEFLHSVFMQFFHTFLLIT